MTEIHLRYSYATSPRDGAMELKGIVHQAHFGGERVFAQAHFARGLTHFQLYERYTDTPVPRVPVGGRKPEFDSIAVFSHLSFV